MSGLDIPHNRVMIDIACNDPDNGVFAYCAEQIKIGAQFLELEAVRKAPRFVELSGGFRFIDKFWPTCGSKDLVGNWCWKGYWMDIPIAVEFLAWLQGRNLFHCSCGEERAYNIWNVPVRMTADDRAFFNRMLGKPSTWSFAWFA